MGNLHHASRQYFSHGAMCVILDLIVFDAGLQERHDPTE